MLGLKYWSHVPLNCFPPRQVRQMLVNSDLDPNMFSALAPGAWWEVANGAPLPPIQPYADEAGEAAIEAARRGALEVSNCL